MRAMRPRWVGWAVGLLLLVFVAEVAFSTRRLSLSWDEGDHIYSGYMNWKEGTYALNPEHPPLVKLVAALPLLPLKLKVAPRQGRSYKLEAYFGGRELLYRNGAQYGGLYGADTLLFRMHMAAFVFALMLAWLVWAAGAEMFGWMAGLIALTLFVFDPSMIANAPFVATDVGGSWGYFAGVYTFYQFTRRMTWGRGLVCGLVTGLALGTKHSEVVLPGVQAVLGGGLLAGEWWRGRRGAAPEHRKSGTGRWGFEAQRLMLGWLGICVLAVTVLWAIYGFRFAMHAAGIAQDPLEATLPTVPALPRAAILFCTRYHLLPESYLYGLADVLKVGVATPMFLMGRVYAHGLWTYFPAVLSLKLSVGLLGLLGLAVRAIAAGRRKADSSAALRNDNHGGHLGVTGGREVWFMAFPPAFFLVVAMAGPLNVGIRHVLPVMAFVMVLAGYGAAWAAGRGRVWAGLAVVLVGWHVVDSVRLYPDYQSYANALWGGPGRTHEYFSDSAVDWGQQLKEVKAWTDEQGVRECWFAYFVEPFVQQNDYGIPCKPLPTADTMEQEDIAVPEVVHGPVLVSEGTLNGFEFGTSVRNPYQSLYLRRPDAMIANAVAVYHGDFRLPEARAMEFWMRSGKELKTEPAQALADARVAVRLAPEGFDANMALGNALAASGDAGGARAAFAVAMRRVQAMEPSAQEQWRPVMEEKLRAVQ